MGSTFDYIFNDPELLKMIDRHGSKSWIKNIYKNYIIPNSVHHFYVSDQETANYYIYLISKVIELMNRRENAINVAPMVFKAQIKFYNVPNVQRICVTMTYYKDGGKKFKHDEN